MSLLTGNIAISQTKAVKERVKVLEVLKHDPSAYTQGLFFYKGKMYESCGEYGKSSFRLVDYKTGSVLNTIRFPKNIFIEGSTEINNRVYILTWQENICFVYDINTLKSIGKFYNPREGWGLTNNGKELIMSDGTSSIYFLDPQTFKEQRKVNVTINGKSVDYLNELEYIKGKIWANVYTTDSIVVIDPQTGVVERIIDCSGILPSYLKRGETDVLNGIAYNPLTDEIFITGKNWPQLFKVSLNR